MADDNIDISIKADTKDAKKNIDDLDKSSVKLSETLKKIGTIGAGVFTAIVGLTAKSIQEYSKQEAATNKLNQALANQGLFTEELSKKYTTLASTLQEKSTFGDEEIINAQAIIQSYSKQTVVTEELTKAILDLAAGQDGDVSAAAKKMGMAISGASSNVKGLNLDMTNLSSVQERSAEVIRAVNAQFRGQAEVATQGAGGWKQLQNTFSDILEDLGKKLLPVVTVLKNEAEKMMSYFRSSSGMEDFKNVVQGTAIAAMVLKNVIISLGESIGAVMGRAQSLSEILKISMGNFSGLSQRVTESVTTSLNGTKSPMEAWKSTVKNLFGFYSDSVKETFVDQKDIIANSVEQISKDILAIEKAFAEESIKNDQIKNDKLKEQSDAAREQAKADAESGRLDELQATQEYDDLTREQLIISTEKRNAYSQLQLKNQLAYQKTFFSTAATLQTAKNKELALIGKAAAITQIAIATPPAVAQSYKFGTGIGGPITGGIFAAIAAAAMAVQAANIAGVAVAQGGMIQTGFANQDNVPAILEKGEFVAPKESADDIINARAREIAGQNTGGNVGVELSLKGDLIKFIEAKILERRATGVSAI